MGIFDKITEALTKNEEPKGLYGQTDEENKVVAFIKSKVEESRSAPARIAFESQVVTNTAYLLGFDSVQFDAATRMFRNIDRPAGRNRMKVHVNLILPTIQNRQARLCKNPPKYDVPPESMAQEDKDAARLSLKALNNLYNQERMNEKRLELTMWVQQAGHGWLKTSWNPNKGKQLAVPPTPENPKGGVEYEGDIDIEVVSPLEVYIDVQAKTLQESPWLIQAKVRKLNYFVERYPEKGQFVKEEGAWLLSVQNANRISQMNSKGTAAPSPEQMKNAAIELAYYERPTKRYPNGRMIVTANGVLLEYKDLPIDEIPFVKFDDIKVAGKFFSESIITHLRAVQDQMNRNMRRKAEFLNKGLNLKIIAPKGHGLSQESWNDSTEVIEFNPVQGGPEPKALQNPQMPNYVYSDTESLRSYYTEISGLSEVSKGQLPSASIPAMGMQILQEADETRLGVIIESNENSYADNCRHVLKFMNGFYTTPRYIRESGANGEYTITAYVGSDLRNHTNPVVIKGSTLPNSKVLKRQEILNIYSQGLLPQSPDTPRRVLQELEFGDLAGIWEDQVIDDAQVKRTIEQIEQGIVPIVDPDDNHAVHFEAKNRLRKSEKFEMYPPEIQQILLADIAQHKQFMMPPMPMAPPVTGAPPVPDEGAAMPLTEEPPMPIEATA